MESEREMSATSPKSSPVPPASIHCSGDTVYKEVFSYSISFVSS